MLHIYIVLFIHGNLYLNILNNNLIYYCSDITLKGLLILEKS